MDIERLKADPRFGTQADFDGLFEHTKQWTVDCLADGSTTDIIPKIVVLARSKEDMELQTIVIVLPDAFHDEKTKWESMRYLGGNLVTQGQIPLAVALVTEAWQAPDGPCMPKDNPQRREIVMVSALDCMKRWCRGATLPIRRRVDNTIEPGPLTDMPAELTMPLLEAFFQGSLRQMSKNVAKFNN